MIDRLMKIVDILPFITDVIDSPLLYVQSKDYDIITYMCLPGIVYAYVTDVKPRGSSSNS